MLKLPNIKVLSNLFLEHKEAGPYAIEINDLSVSYGKNKVISGINLNIRGGEIFGIIGLSGSGKTTMLKPLLNLVSYDGEIKFGHDYRKIGYCPQEDAFIEELSIKENIIIFASMFRLKKDEALNKAAELMKDLELDEDLDKRSGELSGGQRKRLNIILSILHNPKVILLDEPFAGLDYLNRALLWKFFLKIKRKDVTILLTTHLLEEAEKYCSRVFIISKGKKFASGTISDLKRKLKFQYLLKVKFTYLSKANLEEIKEYAKKHEHEVFVNFDNTLGFSLAEENDKAKILEFLEKLKLSSVVTEFRSPDLNDLFMVSTH